nr:MAG TPA: hypothetical protein [Caudoviricetes sp.]
MCKALNLNSTTVIEDDHCFISTGDYFSNFSI